MGPTTFYRILSQEGSVCFFLERDGNDDGGPYWVARANGDMTGPDLSIRYDLSRADAAWNADEADLLAALDLALVTAGVDLSNVGDGIVEFDGAHMASICYLKR